MKDIAVGNRVRIASVWNEVFNHMIGTEHVVTRIHGEAVYVRSTAPVPVVKRGVKVGETTSNAELLIGREFLEKA